VEVKITKRVNKNYFRVINKRKYLKRRSKMGMKSLSLFIIGTILNFNTFALVNYNLEQAKLNVVSDNNSVAIAYENYVRAQHESRAASLALLPSFSVEMFLFDYQYTILRSVIPEPSRFFSAAASKELKEAARLNELIVKRNMLADLEKSYYLHQMHKDFLPLLADEVIAYEELEAATLEAYELGVVDFAQYYSAKTAALSARSVYLNAEQVVAADELGLKLILKVDNDETLELDREEFYNRDLPFPELSKDAETIAVNNSKEIETFDYNIQAAKQMKKGVAISWLSWGGVGFDYFARNSIAKSNIRKLENQRTKTVYETKNQVSKFYKLIDNQNKKIEIQKTLVEMAHNNYEAKLANYNELRGTKIDVTKAGLSLFAAQRELVKLDYELEVLYISLKRLMGSTMISNEVPQE
jgi:hypothetical protein